MTNDELAATLTTLVDRAAVLNGTKWRSAWINTSAYNARDIVSYNGNTYMSLVNSNINANPTSTPTRWANITVEVATGLGGSAGISDGVSIDGDGSSGDPYSIIPSYIAGLVPGFGQVLARAQSLLGPTITKAFGTDFDTTSWIATPTLVNTATADLSTTLRGGVIELKTGGGANSSAIVRPVGVAAGKGGIVINPTTELWYMRSRSQFATAIDANTYNGIALASVDVSGIGMWIGAIGLRSTTNFTYDFYNNAGTATVNGSLGVALDTNYHVFELWGDGVNFYCAIDGIQRLSVAIPASTTNPCHVRLDAFTGATATNRQLNTDDLVICTAG